MATWSAKAQEVAGDSLRLPAEGYVPPFELSTDVKDYGGFLLDMGLMELAPTIPFTLRPTFSYKDKPVNYNQLFKLNSNMLFTQGNYPSLSGAMNFFATPTSMTMSSFRLNTIGSLFSFLPVPTVFSFFISDSGMRKSLWIQKYREPFPSRG